jgi:hydrogenase nickel incorporation protein HypA/HybF
VHEMGITAGILATAVEAAEAEGATRINSVTVSIGDLTEIVEDALQFAWEALTPETIAEGSVLIVVHVPATSHCVQCGTDFEHDKWDMTCTSCGGFLVEPLTGRELRIDSMDIDTD